MLDFSQNYFELFGLPVGFDLDLDQLADQYRQVQRVVHPDRFANASDQERRLAVQASGHINQAFETLKSPLLRATYMLSLNGIDMSAQQGTTTDAMFLMEQMELREALAEARNQADPYAVIDKVLVKLKTQKQALMQGFAEQFGNGDQDSLELAREGVRKLQFLEKLGIEAENLEAALDDELG